MTDLSKICPACMNPLDNEGNCPKCGYDHSPNEAEFLQIGTIVQEKYYIGKVISFNGEGVTYMGFDGEMDAPVHIREYFPRGLCTRANDGVYANEQSADAFAQHKKEFLDLARVMARMRNLSAILPVYDIFEENDTAYYISEAIEYITLRDFLVRNGGRVTFDQMNRLFKPVLATLSSLHSVGVIHKGISPETLIIGRDGRIRLDGFCISDVRCARTDLTPELFKGYAAIEQYGFEGECGAWTDVYSIAAVIYRALIGSPPPDAAERVTNDRMIIPPEIAEVLPAYGLTALADGLQILPADRTQSVDEFRDELSAAPNVVNRGLEETGDERPVRRRKKQSNKKYVAVAAAITVVVLAAVIGILWYTVFRKPDDTQQKEQITTATQPDYSGMIADHNKVEVPDFTKLTAAKLSSQDDSQMVEYNKNFKITLKRKEDASTRGTILSQSVKAGSKVVKGTEITLEVSIGDGMITVPNVTGMAINEGIATLCKNGFYYENIVVQEVYDTSEKADTVLSQSIQQGQKINEFTIITIRVNSAKVAETTTTTERRTEPETEPEEEETTVKTSRVTTTEAEETTTASEDVDDEEQ